MTRSYEIFIRETVRLLDVVIIFGAFYLSYFIRNMDWFAPTVEQFLGDYLPLPPTPTFQKEDYENILWMIVPLWLFLLTYSGTYNFQRAVNLWRVFWELLKVHAIGLFFIGLYVVVLSEFDYKRSFFLMFILFTLAGTFMVRGGVHWVLRAIREHGRLNNRTIIVGAGTKAMKLLSEMRNRTYWGHRISGIVTELPETEENILGIPVVGSIAGFGKLLRSRPVDDVFVALDETDYAELKRILKTCENMGVDVHLVPDKYDLELAKSTLNSMGDMEFISFTTQENKPAQRLVKRVVDFAVSLALLPVLLVLFFIVGAAIKLDSPGPVIFRSMRVTRNRRRFFIFKFRTMVQDADTYQDELNALNEMEGPIVKIKDDPRVTRVGRFLRKWSIDELPQILNVLMGDMSLVGPRPPTVEEVAKYTTPQLRKLSMPQGITGLWQVEGRDEIKRFEDRLKLDLQYIDNWSLWLDAKILAKTVVVVLKGAM